MMENINEDLKKIEKFRNSNFDKKIVKKNKIQTE